MYSTKNTFRLCLPGTVISIFTMYSDFIMVLSCRDGRLQENDQILAIDNHALDANISHKQAIWILQKASGQVELVVARGPIAAVPPAPLTAPPNASATHTAGATKPSDHSAGSTLDRTPSHASEGSDMVVSVLTIIIFRQTQYYMLYCCILQCCNYPC